ncbi:MAG: C-terminal binding protein, partial [Chloroflexota bacterium]
WAEEDLMSRLTILAPDPFDAPENYAPERAIAAAFGGELILGEERPARLHDAEVILIAGMTVPATVMPELARCRLIVRYGIGVDTIDVAAATAHGIVVANAPTYCVAEVADHTAALILSLTRRIPWLDRQVRAGEWSATRSKAGGVRRLSMLTLGIVGLGRIGRELTARMIPFGIRMIAHDPRLEPGAIEALGAQSATFEALLRQSDIISLHVPLTAATRHLIDEEALALMKPTAMLINASRGTVVDEAALIRALDTDRLAGAALDVLEQEPPAPDHPLLRMDPRRVILTPHFAAWSEDAFSCLHQEVAAAVEAVLGARWPAGTVNPEVAPKHDLKTVHPGASG